MNSLANHVESTLQKADFPHIAFAAMGSVITWITKTYTPLIWGFFAAVLLDLISGMIRGWYTKTFSSKRMRETAVKLFFYLSVLTMVVILGSYKPVINEVLVPLEWFFISVEVTSMVENGKACGVNLGGEAVEKFLSHLDTKE